MSETFQHYLAGLIATAQEFSLLWAPTVNSYKRFSAGFMGADGDRLGCRQSHARVSQGRPRQRLSRRVPHSRQRCQQLLRLRRPDRRRALRDPQRTAARGAVQRQRLRGDGHRSHPVEPARRHCAVGGLGDRQGVLRRRRAPPHPDDGQGRVAGRQPDGDRLGVAPLLGADLGTATVMSEIRPFLRHDREQLTDLVNAHVKAVRARLLGSVRPPC